MRITSIALASAFWALVLSNTSSAQPILNRVEQLLRQQLAAPRNPAANPAVTGNEPGYLGLIGDDRQEQGRGVRITNVVPGGPAAQGGLQTGDLITAINAQPIRSMDDMGPVMEKMLVGAQLTITVDRGGAQREQQVTLGRRALSPASNVAPEIVPSPKPTPSPAAAPVGPKLGIRTSPVTEDARAKNGLSNTQGAVVVSVAAGSNAERAGVPIGAVITAVNNRPVGTPDELAAAVRRAGSGAVVLTYFAEGKQIHKQVPLSGPTLAGEGPQLELRGRPVAASPEEDPVARQVDPPQAEPQDTDARVSDLQERVRQLEDRLEKLEAAAAEARKLLPR